MRRTGRGIGVKVIASSNLRLRRLNKAVAPATAAASSAAVAGGIPHFASPLNAGRLRCFELCGQRESSEESATRYIELCYSELKNIRILK